jgi:endonuclease YncB( thermonuclease family)
MVTRLLLTSFTVFLFPYFCFAGFTGPVVSVLDGDTIEVLHNTHPERVRSAASTALRRAKLSATERSRLPLSWCLKRNGPHASWLQGRVVEVGGLRPV